MGLPQIIQGGMGVAVSDWRLASTVSQLGQLGVISGTGMSRVLLCRLMDGDPDGHMRRALSKFPFQDVVETILEKYYVPGGKSATTAYELLTPYTFRPSKFLDQITAVANFVEVYLAKEGHDGVIGINLLEKVQFPTMASLYGAMLAGVDYVLMGAGIPTQIAGLLDKYVNHEKTTYRIDVIGAHNDDDFRLEFDPERIFPGIGALVGPLKRPNFLPIISSVVLAQALIKRSEGAIFGFIVEGPLAGGHNAPPRGPLKLNDLGEPIYGEKDEVDLKKLALLGLPFWLAGSYGNPDKFQEALAAGAAGVQMGTAFALCNESGMEHKTKSALIAKVLRGEAEVFTNPVASPTGFPFKVALLEGTLSDEDKYQARPRICDLAFLRSPYKLENAEGRREQIGYRCAAEPEDDFVRKGGELADTVGRTCLCNTLAATAGYAQYRPKIDYLELPMVTTGNDLVNIGRFFKPGATTYSAKDVIDMILGAG
jgi:nitronate monooxygenase